MSIATFPRARLDVGLPNLLAQLPKLGRVMVIARAPTILLERLGTIESAEIDGTTLILSGENHDAQIDATRLDTLILDRTVRMGDKVLPRIEFRNAADDLVFSVVGMEGLEGFDAALATLPRTEVDAEIRLVDNSAAPELSPDDPVTALLEPLRAAAAHVTITLDIPGMRQGWTGMLPDFHPAMGWFNIISRTFHLHVAAGAVAGWQSERGQRIALGPDGRPMGLIVASDAFI